MLRLPKRLFLPKRLLLTALTLLLLHAVASPAFCGPPPAAQRQTGTGESSLPDYGGRDSVGGTLQGVGVGDVSPAAQGLRALESLVVVLALVVGGVYGAKRLGLVNKDGRFSLAPGALRPISSYKTEGDPIAVQSSQPLPGGGGLHVVSVSGRTWLLGATAQSVTLLAELNAPDAENAPDAANDGIDTAFAALLARNVASGSVPALSDTADRLQSLLSHSRSISPTGSFR